MSLNMIRYFQIADHRRNQIHYIYPIIQLVLDLSNPQKIKGIFEKAEIETKTFKLTK